MPSTSKLNSSNFVPPSQWNSNTILGAFYLPRRALRISAVLISAHNGTTMFTVTILQRLCCGPNHNIRNKPLLFQSLRLFVPHQFASLQGKFSLTTLTLVLQFLPLYHRSVGLQTRQSLSARQTSGDPRLFRVPLRILRLRETVMGKRWILA